MSATDKSTSGLRLRHYGHKPIERVRRRVQEYGEWKPRGLWVSVEGNNDGWREWCEAEAFSGGWTHVYAVTLAVGANVLHVDTEHALVGFHERWADYFAPYPGATYKRAAVDWQAVAKEYDGIIIAPYQWHYRLEGEISEWYYGWDCASGCIWRPRAISSFTRVNEEFARIREPAEVVA